MGRRRRRAAATASAVVAVSVSVSRVRVWARSDRVSDERRRRDILRSFRKEK